MTVGQVLLQVFILSYINCELKSYGLKKNLADGGYLCAKFSNKRVLFVEALKNCYDEDANVFEPKTLGELRMYTNWLSDFKWTATHVFLNYASDLDNPDLFRGPDLDHLPFESSWAKGIF